MLCYLDTCIVIYAVEGQPALQKRARDHVATLEAAGYRFAISQLTHTECLVKPLGGKDGQLLLEYQRFFVASNLATIEMTSAIYCRAAYLRGTQLYSGGKSLGLADSLHLAAALDHGADSFLTNDQRLHGFDFIRVEELP